MFPKEKRISQQSWYSKKNLTQHLIAVSVIFWVEAQDGLDPSLTRFNYPTGMALQKMSGGVKLYVSDSANHQVTFVLVAG